MTSETSSAKVTDEPKKVDFCDAWFQQDIKQLPDATRELFETYSGVEADEVIDHIQGLSSPGFGPSAIWKSEEYDSLRTNSLGSGMRYQYNHPQLFLDLGCCLAQDLWKLVFDGVPSENLYGLDIESGFSDLSYDLFRDRDTLKSRFVVEDMFVTGDDTRNESDREEADDLSAGGAHDPLISSSGADTVGLARQANVHHRGKFVLPSLQLFRPATAR
ncbi:MAG: hypothetical protein L6R40_004835 [Gallowayella cf. fulva]|nr:MAG: hypothetical protein L6R40_004835 [Xanthomendoza cf. fulva]